MKFAPDGSQLRDSRERLESHTCRPGESEPVNDARGIYLCRVCPECREAKLATFRPDVLTDPSYWHDEPIEPEDY